MAWFYAAPDDSGFIEAPTPGNEDWGGVPDGWVEVDREEFDRRLAAQRQAAGERTAAFLREARAPQVEAGRALVELGLSAAQAAAVAGVPAAELQQETS